MSRLIVKYTNNLSRSKPAVSVLLDVCSRNAVKSSRYSSTLCEMSRLSPLICPTMLRRRQLICQGLTNVNTIQKYSTQEMGDDDGCVVRLRGFLYEATAEEILRFLGDEIAVDGGESGVHILFFPDGRGTGQAFVELTDEDNVTEALKKHRRYIGDRFIEVYKSNKNEMDCVIKQASQLAGSKEAVVRLWGVPKRCSKEEIAQFFTGLEIVPNGIMLPHMNEQRLTYGIAYVQFATQEIAKNALLKHNEYIRHRHIEIFKCGEVYNERLEI